MGGQWRVRAMGAEKKGYVGEGWEEGCCGHFTLFLYFNIYTNMFCQIFSQTASTP
jgi:hypothetical protein